MAGSVGDSMALVRSRIARARSLCVFTGAGMSAESGIPTLTDANAVAFWSHFKPNQMFSADGLRSGVNINPHDSEIDPDAHIRIADTAARSLPMLSAAV